jgi:hypothetical protein
LVISVLADNEETRTEFVPRSTGDEWVLDLLWNGYAVRIVVGRVIRLINNFKMNIKQLESKFKNLEQKEKEIRHFYNPMRKGGSKHLYIKDLWQDYQYDLNMYGGDLSRFNNVTPPTVDSDKSPSPTSQLNISGVMQMKSVRGSNREIYPGFFSNMNIKSPGTRGSLVTAPERASMPSNWQYKSSERAKVRNVGACEDIAFSGKLKPVVQSKFLKGHRRMVQKSIDIVKTFQPSEDVLPLLRVEHLSLPDLSEQVIPQPKEPRSEIVPKLNLSE